MEGAAAIHTNGLTKDFGQGHGLFELDLDVRPGEIVGFLGPNYYAGHDPLGHGVDAGDLTVPIAAALGLTAAAVVSFRRRDLRK